VRLGKRSARGRSGDGGQLIRLALGLSVAFVAAAAAETLTAGPARIVCNASFCELGTGSRPKERIRVIVSELPHDEIRRLRKCTGVATPCIVTIEGTERGGPMRIMASGIHWQGQD
jgi:hypothetical protein